MFKFMSVLGLVVVLRLRGAFLDVRGIYATNAVKESIPNIAVKIHAKLRWRRP
jgi:hypothetical protein